MSKHLSLFAGFVLALLAGAGGSARAGEIHEAIAAGDAARVGELLRADPGAVRERDATPTRDLPLHTAAIHGQVEIARLLLEAGAELDAGDADESTPLHDACLRRQREMVAFLLERGADIHRRDHNAAYSLSFAASGGDTAIVRMLLEAGVDLYHRDRSGFSMLHWAVRANLEPLVDSLLALGEDVNARTIHGDTPLMWATARRLPAMAEKLLAHGARPDLGNADGDRPLHRAAQRGFVDLGRLLLAWGADARCGTGIGWDPSPLHDTCWDGQAEFARLLLAHGADPSASAGGRTPLEMAVKEGHAELVAALLAAGAAVETRAEAFGSTALHLAALRGYRGIAQLLLEHGADPSSRNTRGETPLELAGRHGQGGVAELLRERGAAGRAPESPPALASFAGLPEKEAVIWFLEHSGWGVKTRDHFLVFDYFERRPAPDEPGLGNGHIVPADLAGENVIVFVSHAHSDHYDPRIWEWRAALPQATFVLGFRPEQEVPAHEFIGPRETRSIGGATVTTIESNDSGVGFLVEIDGLTILHAGDHANRQVDFSSPYKEEIDWLAARGGRPDIAFFPISGCGFGNPEAVRLGVHYALSTLQPRVFFPMHYGDLSTSPLEFVAECRARFPKTRMETGLVRGDRFRYAGGRVELLADRAE